MTTRTRKGSMPLAERRKLAKAFRRLMESYNGTQRPQPHGWDCTVEYDIATRFGPARFTMNGPFGQSTDIGDTIFGRFEDAKSAAPSTGCNPYSGKWNHHYIAGYTAQEAIEDFEWRLLRVIGR